MKIAVACDAPQENSPVSAVFGRCAYFAIYDGKNIEFIPNTSSGFARGAGIQAAQMLASMGVNIAITGGIVGPNASMVLAQAGISVVNGFHGTVKDAIESVQRGTMSPMPPNIPLVNEPPFITDSQSFEYDELKMLEEEKAYIEERLEDIKKRLNELKN